MLYTGVAQRETQLGAGLDGDSAGPMQRAGKIRFIAITRRSARPAFPDLPTVGRIRRRPPNYEVTGWTTIAAPKRPAEGGDRTRSSSDIEAALAEPDIKRALRHLRLRQPSRPRRDAVSTPSSRAESAKYADMIKRAKASRWTDMSTAMPQPSSRSGSALSAMARWAASWPRTCARPGAWRSPPST